MIDLAPRRSLAALRWGVAALVVAAAHGGVGWAAFNWRVGVNEAAAGAPEQAIMIELAALSVAPEAPPEELPPAQEAVAPEPVKEPPPEVEPEIEPPPPMPEPVIDPPPVEPPPEPEPEPVALPEPEIRLPEIPELPDPAAVLAPPPPKPPEKPKVVEKPKPKPKPKPRVVERKPPPERKRAERAAAPPPAPQRASAPNPPAPGTAAQSAVSTASWRGSLIAHLNRHKRFPGGASPGTVQIAFTIDRSGRVLSASLARSSGDPALDQEAVAMIRRASPVPAPPAGIGGGGAVSLAVPIRYTR